MSLNLFVTLLKKRRRCKLQILCSGVDGIRDLISMGTLNPRWCRSVVCSRLRPHFHGHLKASLQPLSGVFKLTLPIETPVIHVPLSGRVGGALSHKSYSILSWVDQTTNGRLRRQSPRSGFAVIGPFEHMPAGACTAPPRCHPPPDGGTLRHVNNSLPRPLSEGSVHGNWSRQPDNWRSALAEPFVTVLAHGNGVKVQLWEAITRYRIRISENRLRGRIEMGLLLCTPFCIKKVAPFL